MAIAQDISTPAPVILTNSSATTCQVPSGTFSPPAGSIVVIVVNIGLASTQATGPTVTVADSMLNDYFNAAGAVYDGQFDHTSIFTLYYEAAPGAISVTVTRSVDVGAALFMVTPYVLTGVAVNQAPAAGHAGASNGGTSVDTAITAAQIGSWIICAGGVGASGMTASVFNGITTDQNQDDTTDARTALTGHVVTTSTGSQTFGWTLGTGANPNVVSLLEILPQPPIEYVPFGKGGGNLAAVSSIATSFTGLTRAVGDIIVMGVNWQVTSGTISEASGKWTQLTAAAPVATAPGVVGAVFYRVVPAGNVSAPTFTLSAGSGAVMWGANTYRPIDSASVDVFSSARYTVAATTHTPPAVTPTGGFTDYAIMCNMWTTTASTATYVTETLLSGWINGQGQRYVSLPTSAGSYHNYDGVAGVLTDVSSTLTPGSMTVAAGANGVIGISYVILLNSAPAGASTPVQLPDAPWPAPTWFPGADGAVSAPGRIPFYIDMVPMPPQVEVPLTAYSPMQQRTSPGWFPGADDQVCRAGGVPFYCRPTPGPAVSTTDSPPGYGTASGTGGGGTGVWVNPGNADGPPDGLSATWTAP